jgi:sigma-B regulation protein RsbU (phosphoserine phosphatase)
MTGTDRVVDVSQDWVLACDVQQRFMEGCGPPTSAVDYSAECRQIRALGGDCYDFTPLADGRMTLLVGDASGKGLAAALMIASVQSSIRAAAVFSRNDLAALLKVVNHLAYTSSLADRYATVFYGVFDEATRTLHYVNAGHHAPAVLHRNGSVEWLETGGAPIGMLPDSNYEERLITLEPGDVVIAFTDGVIEATNQSREEWGVEGLLKASSGAAQDSRDADDLVKKIFDSMDAFSSGHQSDDATLAVLRVI